MRISVIICTYKREDYLVKAINSLLDQQTKDHLDYEVLVVDNSLEGTAKLVVDQIKSGRLKYFHETQTGLSHARNRGIKESSGKIIAFIDDDAIADSNWLTEICRIYDEYDDAMCVGGRVDMLLSDDVDLSWLPHDFFAYLSILDFGDNLFYARDHTEYPIGVNISFKREVFDHIGLFDTSLGRKGTSLLSCEDSEFCYKIQTKIPQSKIYYNSKAIVKHNVIKERLKKEWFLRRLYWQGISESYFDKRAFGMPYVVRRAVKNITLHLPLYFKEFLYYSLAGDVKLSFYFKGMILKELGYVQQSYGHVLFKDKKR